ncbi:MAG: hypothetical protein R2795_25380 [Saprospiraceae bacterium]
MVRGVGAQTVLRVRANVKVSTMTIDEIKNKSDLIKDLIANAKFRIAIDELKNFIEELGDDDLENNIIIISARYNHDYLQKLLGTSDNEIELNKLIKSLLSILRIVEKTAKEKIKPNENLPIIDNGFDNKMEISIEKFREKVSLFEDFDNKR